MDTLKVHNECKEIYNSLFETEDGESISCDIWRAMVGENEEFDNCIGENFNQILWTIKNNWFENDAFASTSIDFYNTNYLLWLYLVVARVYEVFDALNPDNKNDLITKKRLNLKFFNEINLWAKFIKHPKEFIFCHWPEYCCEGQRPTKTVDRLLINSSYLKEHYTSEQDKRPVALKNNTNVVVQYPKLSRITEGFVKDFRVFRDFLCNNEMIIDELKKDTNVPLKKNHALPTDN
jgi:hypothetical protein